MMMATASNSSKVTTKARTRTIKTISMANITTSPVNTTSMPIAATIITTPTTTSKAMRIMMNQLIMTIVASKVNINKMVTMTIANRVTKTDITTINTTIKVVLKMVMDKTAKAQSLAAAAMIPRTTLRLSAISL